MTAVTFVPVSEIDDYHKNSNTHPESQLHQIEALMQSLGWTIPALLRRKGERYEMIAGHGRKQVARERFYDRGKTLLMANGDAIPVDTIPAVFADGWNEDQVRAYVIADNQVPRNSIFDEKLLAEELAALKEMDFDLGLTGFENDEIDRLLADLDADVDGSGVFGGDPGGDGERISLADRFMIPPFTVLNAREGWWTNRKAQWINTGIKSEIGRDADLLFATGCQPPEVYDKKQAYEAEIGRKLTWEEFHAARPDDFQTGGVSIFDPVLCEIAYRWFSPVGGLVLDPFAGGSVRGIVAAKLGRQYIGHELRAEQVTANREQASEICGQDEVQPVWVEGDSRLIAKTCQDVEADMVFSCPPYADLEVYSDNPDDLSTLEYADFRQAYFEIIAKTCELLKPDSFACFVVGDVRDKKGNYYNFVGDTVEAFRAAGLAFYNEAILVTSVGSLPIRAGKAFSTSRKLGKTHQNILVFIKGDAKKAAARCGEVDVSDALENAELNNAEDTATEFGEVL
ncbi:MAG: hypothetical protein R3F02_18655 [Thiolinea sp.]